MKFIADSMLGRLARWLRLLGHDTLYFADIDDSRLLRIAREEERTLLTRDTRLVRVRGMKNFLLLTDNDPFCQLRQVLREFDLAPSSAAMSGQFTSRCSLCNTPLEDAVRDDARGHVPPYVYHSAGRFRKCPHCDKFYWQGTHQERLLRKLQDIL
ncbi:MAG: Mut7-C RNAse domain-containing protein [Nitrospiraceae bacterium]|nr:MAG: Mut7-C RNAse domain-containing protein [Nitrospiraceae bacterium]